MTELAKKMPSAPVVSDAIKHARARGLELVSDNLPKVADATDRVGKNLTDFLRASAKTISDKALDRRTSTVSQFGSLLGTSWLLRGAGRLAARHPLALLAGGTVIAVAGLAAWRLSQRRPDQDASMQHDETDPDFSAS